MSASPAQGHVLDIKIPFAIAVQDLIKEHKLENKEIRTPTKYDTANIVSIQQRCELTKIIKKGITSDKAANRLEDSYIEWRYGSILKIFTDGS